MLTRQKFPVVFGGKGSNLYSKRVQEFSRNLVAHWPLNELAGSVAYDKSVNGNHGAITGTTLGQPGIGDGLTSQYFDGANDFIDISAIASDLISNGGFETAGTGGADIWADWSEVVSDGALANEGVEIHTGADACKITAGASANTYVWQNITVVPGENRLRLWTRGDGTHDGRYSLYDVTNSNWLAYQVATGVTGTSYAMADVDVTLPASCVSLRVYCYCPSTDTGVCYFDTVSLRRTDKPSFDPHEGSVIVWAKIPSAAWTDNATRVIVWGSVDAKNRVGFYKSTSNDLAWLYEGNDLLNTEEKTITPLDWFSMGITWSQSGNLLTYYYKGDAEGTDSGTGVWTGVLSATDTALGALSTAPDSAHLGNLAHVQLYNTPHDADTMKYLMRLPS